MLTGELSPIHPGRTQRPRHDSTRDRRVHDTSSRDPSQTATRSRARARRTRISTRLAWIARSAAGSRYPIAYVRKDGRNFIGWTDVGGQYREESRPLPDGRTVQVFRLTNAFGAIAAFRLTNPEDYSLTYNGLVMAVEKRRSDGWQAFGSYTLSRAPGCSPPAERPPRARRSAPSARRPPRSRRRSRSDAIRTI